MSDQDQPRDIGAVLDCVEAAGEGEKVSISDIVDEIGPSAFGPLLLVPALILVTPASGVPSMPTIGSLIISLIAIQIVIGRETVWLPKFIRRRSIGKERIQKALGYLRRPAAFIDRVTGKRLAYLTKRPFIIVPALICSSMVLLSPVFETVPFSVSIAALAVAIFALALVAQDGLLVILGLVLVAAGVAGVVLWL
jgi:hypothetical protein